MNGVPYRGKLGVGTSQVDGRWSEGATCIEAIKLNADSEELNGRLEVCQDGTIYNAILGKRMMEAPEVVTSTYGKAIKYPDGIMIQTVKWSTNITTWTAWGTCYAGTLNTPPNYTVAFKEVYAITAGLENTGSNCWLVSRTEETGYGTTSRPPAYQVARPNSASGTTITVNIIAIGRWK